MNDESPERPWTEAQWEELLRRSDVRSARFGELLETLMDHPDRDEIIEREMGWDQFEDDDVERPWLEELNRELTDEEMDEADEDAERSNQELEQLPAYARAYPFGLTVHKSLKPYCVEDQEEQDEDLVEAMANCFTIAVKLAGAHTFGYDDHSLCGNIVCCKRSQEAAESCLRALQALRDRGVVPADVCEPLIQECAEVLRLVQEHIAELRSRVWWQ